MLPYTAQKLKSRKTNKLKDFVSVAGPMGVTHLMMLTQSREIDPNKQKDTHQHQHKLAPSSSPGAPSSAPAATTKAADAPASSMVAPEDSDDALGAGVQLRVARMPRGPTLTFRVQRFALPAEVLAS